MKKKVILITLAIVLLLSFQLFSQITFSKLPRSFVIYYPSKETGGTLSSFDTSCVKFNLNSGNPIFDVFNGTGSSMLSLGSTGNFSIGGYFSADDSIRMGSGKWIRKIFQSAGGDSLGFIYYNSIDSKTDTVYANGKYQIEDKDALLFAPDGINDEIVFFHVDADKYPNGIKLLNVQITLPADAAYSMVFEEWSGDPPTAENDIETVITTASDSYMEVKGGDIDDSDIDADDYIFLHVPATDVDWISVKVIYYIK